MYSFVLSIHGLLRWAVLGLGLFSLFRALTGIVAKGGWLPRDEFARKWFPVSMDIAFTFGIALWGFLSPITRAGFHDPAHAMADHDIRFYLVEHSLAAVLALALAHVGSARARRLKDSRAKFQSMLVFHGLALVLLASRIPWDRPLLRNPF